MMNSLIDNGAYKIQDMELGQKIHGNLKKEKKILTLLQSYGLESINVIPNPTTGELEIENGELKIKKVEIFDIYGRNLTPHTPNPIARLIFLI